MAQLTNTCSNSIYSIKPNHFVILAYLGEPHCRIWGHTDIKAGRKRRKSSAWPVWARPGGAGPTHTFSTSDTGVKKKICKIFWNRPEHHAISATRFFKWLLYKRWEEEWNSLLMSSVESPKHHERNTPYPTNMQGNWVKWKYGQNESKCS